MQVKEETRIFPFFSILPLCFMAEEKIEPESPGCCSTEESKQALSSVGLGLGQLPSRG